MHQRLSNKDIKKDINNLYSEFTNITYVTSSNISNTLLLDQNAFKSHPEIKRAHTSLKNYATMPKSTLTLAPKYY